MQGSGVTGNVDGTGSAGGGGPLNPTPAYAQIDGNAGGGGADSLYAVPDAPQSGVDVVYVSPTGQARSSQSRAWIVCSLVSGCAQRRVRPPMGVHHTYAQISKRNRLAPIGLRFGRLA